MLIQRYVCALTLAGLLVAPWAVAQKKDSKSASAQAGSSGLQSALEEREKAGWEAFKNKDSNAYSDLCASDYTAVFADGKGEHDLKSALDAMNQITVNNYKLSDFKLTSLGPDMALLRYNASMNYSMGGGKAEDGKLAVGDLWVKRGGQWKALRYQETEVK